MRGHERGRATYSVTSALMALEAWAHRRIEAGETFEKVLADVLGPPGSPAAYLLVAVDLLLSHWPKSREAAVPFLACPELLCIDRERHVHDNFEYPDIFGLKALQKEPVGAASLESLKKRASRQLMLDRAPRSVRRIRAGRTARDADCSASPRCCTPRSARRAIELG